MKLCIKKIYCGSCQRLVKSHEQEVNTLMAMAKRCVCDSGGSYSHKAQPQGERTAESIRGVAPFLKRIEIIHSG